ncbi:MAG: hypothetical protein PHU66_05795, partial [Bacteroidaceae bacterium]|nr:hypothetical protein [Bacteroidaceae bacterium]
MKKLIIILSIFFGMCTNTKAIQATWWYGEYLNLGTFTTQMIDENHMQIWISFQDNDFSIISYPDYAYKWVGYKTSGTHDWMSSFNGLAVNIPTSGFHVILPADRMMESFECDTIGMHLFATDFSPHHNAVVPDSTSAFVIDQGDWDAPPFHVEQFIYGPFYYDLKKKELWLVSKILIKLTLKPVERYTYSKDRLIGSLSFVRRKNTMTINLDDIKTFYPEVINGIQGLQTENNSCIYVQGKHEIGGSVKEDIRDAYVEIRN